MDNKLLGDVRFPKKNFLGVDSVFQKFKKKEFCSQTAWTRQHVVNQALLDLIKSEPEPCFLFSAVLEFIDRVCRQEILESYSFKNFELWLNQNSSLTFEENYRVRAKIAGQLVDRSDYQVFFPIGGGKIFEGTHFVTAHRSPDLDTTVASFWGWLDAFAARVGNGLHIWNVPGGPPAQIEIDWLFNEIFGAAVFTRLAKTHSALHATGQDLMMQKGMLRKRLSESVIGIDHERDQNAVVVVDENGFYLGDWHSADVESVRDVILLLSSCLRWFENALQLRLMSFFGRENVRLEEARGVIDQLFSLKICESEPGLEFTQKQEQIVSKFIIQVLGIRSGLKCTFEVLGKDLGRLANCCFEDADSLVSQMQSARLFDSKGSLIEERSRVFGYLETTLHTLHATILQLRKRLEHLDIALKTKWEVFGKGNVSIQPHADIEEMRNKMGAHSFLTVVSLDGPHAYPVGVVHAASIHKPVLGTVSLRDFCNREEMGIPTYLEVISVIDHHRTTLTTLAPPFAIISDAQSSNTLVATQAFLLSDRHSLLGQTEAGIEAQLKEHFSQVSPVSTRLTQNLLQRSMIAHQKSKFYLHPEREFVEYLQLIYAIIDDTDLLTKVTVADVECVVQLLNRMKSIAEGRICEIISLDDLPRNREFTKKAAARILQLEDMYSLYRKVYDLRGTEIERNLALAAEGKTSNVFADTKEQNGCCRVGQTKIFASNVESFTKFCGAIRNVWQKSAEKIAREKPEIAMHLHMVSTIVDAEQVYRGSKPKYTHKDELWVWIPKNVAAQELLKNFLGNFASSPGLKNHILEVEIFGEAADELSRIFKEDTEAIVQRVIPTDGPTIAVLRFSPGLLNSRKSMVTPFLPKTASKT
jgi:hypothetical protein